MKTPIVILALISGYFFSEGQVISSGKWSDLFSYNNVLAIREDNGRLVAATENGIFFYTPATGEISKLSKANGLHDVKISAFDYNPVTKVGMVGYLTGAMDMIIGNEVTYIVDIPLATGYAGNKKINHISITGNQAVISTGYGVSIYNINTKGFGDTAFFQNNGVYEASNEAVIKDNKVFSATNSGLKVHAMDVTFPIYSGWDMALSGTFTDISFGGGSIVASTNSAAYFGDGNSFAQISQGFSGITDVYANAQNFCVSENSRVSMFGNTGNFIKTFDAVEPINTGISFSNQIYAGTQLSGILDQNKRTYKPSGPYANTSYNISLDQGKIWVSTGARKDRYNGAVVDPRNLGFYYYNGTEWIYPSFFLNNSIKFDVLDVIANPVDLNEVYFTNYNSDTGKGMYKMKYDDSRKDFDFVKFYDGQSSSIWFNRPVGFAFDDMNNLFVSFSFYAVNSAIVPGIGFYNKTSDDFVQNAVSLSSQAVQKPVFYDKLFWIPNPRQNYFLAYDYNQTPTDLSDDKTYVLNVTNGFATNSGGTLCVSMDKDGDAWIGSDMGLRVLANASTSIKDPNAKVEPIIIEQNGIGEELFRDSAILQIETDSGNQKWVSIDGGGVFYLSRDGQKTFQHFTKENSPLPTNTVTDIKVDPNTGKVYFVTYDGIVTYQGDVVNVSENFGDVLVYPNPVVYSNFKGNVKIRGLAEKTNIRITDAAGNLVHQAVARGGFYEWDLNNQNGNRVASGIYYVLMTNADGTDKATAKIAVVN